ncbi:MAG: hypothetical protein AAFP10_07550 [Pseudomonadota bacterium]
MHVINKTEPSLAGQQQLAVLRQAVSKALDKKRRLGHYAIIWQDGAPVRKEAGDLPEAPSRL